MKQTIMILFCALLISIGRATAQPPTMTAENVEIIAGATAVLKVSLENPMDVAGWQLYLYLPENIDVAFEEIDGERNYDNAVTLSSRHLSNHICTVTPTIDGGYLIMGYSPSKPTNIKEHGGNLVNITLQASDTFSGVHTSTIKNVAVADIYAVQTNVGNDIQFQISSSGTNGVSNVLIDETEESVYRVNGQQAKSTDKGLLIKKRKKVIVK